MCCLLRKCVVCVRVCMKMLACMRMRMHVHMMDITVGMTQTYIPCKQQTHRKILLISAIDVQQRERERERE
jgi:hypothetical protein